MITNTKFKGEIAMPHITIKMLKGRTDEQKMKAAENVKKALCEAIGCTENHVSVSVSDYTAVEWQDQFKIEITENPDIIIKPDYKPEDLL